MNIYLLMSALRCPADAFRIYSVVNDILLLRPVAAVNVTQIMQFFRHNFNSFLVMMVMNRLCLSHIYILCHIYMFFSPHSYLAQHLCIWRMRLLNFKGVWVLSEVS